MVSLPWREKDRDASPDQAVMVAVAAVSVTATAVVRTALSDKAAVVVVVHLRINTCVYLFITRQDA